MRNKNIIWIKKNEVKLLTWWLKTYPWSVISVMHIYPSPTQLLFLCDLTSWSCVGSGGCRSGLVSAHPHPREGHSSGFGGEGPFGESTDRIWKDCSLCYTHHTAHSGVQTGGIEKKDNLYEMHVMNSLVSSTVFVKRKTVRLCFRSSLIWSLFASHWYLRNNLFSMCLNILLYFFVIFSLTTELNIYKYV